MPILSLATMALKQIPFAKVETMTMKEKSVVHYELYPCMFWSASTRESRIRPKPMYKLCSCVNYGRCLCYLKIIRFEMIEMYWGEEQKYERLSGWMANDLPPSAYRLD